MTETETGVDFCAVAMFERLAKVEYGDISLQDHTLSGAATFICYGMDGNVNCWERPDEISAARRAVKLLSMLPTYGGRARRPSDPLNIGLPETRRACWRIIIPAYFGGCSECRKALWDTFLLTVEEEKVLEEELRNFMEGKRKQGAGDYTAKQIALLIKNRPRSKDNCELLLRCLIKGLARMGSPEVLDDLLKIG